MNAVITKSKKKIIYLTGLDRSGSTVTGAVLGTHPEITFYGELQYYPKAAMRNRFISQQKRMVDSLFWHNIYKFFIESHGENMFIEFHNLNKKYERWRNFPILIFHFFIQHPTLKKYWTYNSLLIEELMKNSSKNIVCDSSKNIVRRFALGLSGLFQFHTILLIRDARGYYWSKKSKFNQSKKHSSLLRITLKWITNNLIFAIISILGNFMTINYEALYNDPSRNFNKIGKKVNLDFSTLHSIVTSRTPLRIANVIAGNPGVRNQNELVVQIDESWKRSLALKEKRAITAIAGWLLWLFGYSLSNSNT